MARQTKRFVSNDDFTGEIIKALQQVQRYSGRRAPEIFGDWLSLADATLEALPAQVRHLGRTGEPAPDPPETAELFGRIRSRYAQTGRGSGRAHRKIWNEGFGQAFALLLESSAGGLHDRVGAMGPDVLGHVYMTWANTDPGWRGQYFTPYNVAYLMASMSVPDGEREVHDRVKAALLHPDNVWGQAVLLTSMLLPDGESARDYYFTTVLPAALPWYEKIMFNEPAIGSGTIMLAAAAKYPDWANYWGLISYTGQDLDKDCVRMARINAKLYGLNGYGARLHTAAVEAMQAGRQRTVSLPLAKPLETLNALQETIPRPTFQHMFGPVPEEVDCGTEVAGRL